MNEEQKLKNDTITKLFKLVIEKDLQEHYLKFSKSLNDYLKENYKEIFLCNILLQDKDDRKIIYSVEFYNDIKDEEATYIKLNEKLNKMYNEEFGDKIIRSEITDLKEIKKIIPD